MYRLEPHSVYREITAFGVGSSRRVGTDFNVKDKGSPLLQPYLSAKITYRIRGRDPIAV